MTSHTILLGQIGKKRLVVLAKVLVIPECGGEYQWLNSS